MACDESLGKSIPDEFGDEEAKPRPKQTCLDLRIEAARVAEAQHCRLQNRPPPVRANALTNDAVLDQDCIAEHNVSELERPEPTRAANSKGKSPALTTGGQYRQRVRRENIPIHATVRPRAAANPTRVHDETEAQNTALVRTQHRCRGVRPWGSHRGGWPDSRSAAGRCGLCTQLKGPCCAFCASCRAPVSRFCASSATAPTAPWHYRRKWPPPLPHRSRRPQRAPRDRSRPCRRDSRCP